VTYLTLRRVTRFLKGIYQENGCSLIHPWSWLNRLDNILRVVIEPIQHLPKWAKFTELTQHLKLYQEFLARTQFFTPQSLENPAQHEVVAPAPWHVQLWLVDADCVFYDQTLPTVPDQPTSVHVPPVDTEESIATLQ
jgi:hypothetical protein